MSVGAGNAFFVECASLFTEGMQIGWLRLRPRSGALSFQKPEHKEMLAARSPRDHVPAETDTRPIGSAEVGLLTFSFSAQEHCLVDAAHNVGRGACGAPLRNGVNEVPNALAHADETALGKRRRR